MRFLIKLAVYTLVLAALFLVACGSWVFRQLRFYYWKYVSNPPPPKGPITKWPSVSTSAVPSQRYR